VIDELRASGRAGLVPTVDENLFGLSLNTRVPDAVRRKLIRMTNFGLPTAVFIGPREAVG
jgi:hypothetical protein